MIKEYGREWDRTTDLVINSHTRCQLRHPTIVEMILHSLRRKKNEKGNAYTTRALHSLRNAVGIVGRDTVENLNKNVAK